MKRVLVCCLAIVLAIAGWFLFDYMNDKFFAGVSNLKTLFCSLVFIIPISIYDAVKSKEKSTMIFLIVFFIAASIFLALKIPSFTYKEALNQIESQYEKVYSYDIKYIEKLPIMKLPKDIKGCYLFRVNEDNIEKYVLFSPKTGETQTYDVGSNSFIDIYIDIIQNE